MQLSFQKSFAFPGGVFKWKVLKTHLIPDKLLLPGLYTESASLPAFSKHWNIE